MYQWSKNANSFNLLVCLPCKAHNLNEFEGDIILFSAYKATCLGHSTKIKYVAQV